MSTRSPTAKLAAARKKKRSIARLEPIQEEDGVADGGNVNPLTAKPGRIEGARQLVRVL